MDLHVDDDGFVRAPVRVVYPTLTDVRGWPRWWPGVTVERMAPVTRADEVKVRERWAVQWRLGMVRHLRFSIVPHAYRHDAGFVMDLAGDVEGRAEFWLETREDGTVVHHVMTGRALRGRPQAALRTYRQVLRRGFWGCKDHLQSQVRREAGLAP